MQDNTTGKRFLFHGHAIAAAGKITSPFQDIIPAQAVSALPISGGYSSARVENFRYKEIFSFASAYSEVAGGLVEKDGKAVAYETLSLTAIEKVNVLDVVTCDRVVARITAKYPVDGSTPAIVTAGSRFERLRVGGYFFEKLDLAPDALNKYDALVRPQYVDVPAGDTTSAQGKEYPSDVLSQPWRISIPQFGIVFLGEFFPLQNLRHLQMLRISLGCSVTGDQNIGGAVSGGDPYKT
jgi:hypothetical protein